MDKSLNIKRGDRARGRNTKVARSPFNRSFHQSKKVWRRQVQILRTNVRKVWIPLNLPLDSFVRGATSQTRNSITFCVRSSLPSSTSTSRVTTSVLLCKLTISKLNSHRAPTKSWNAESSRMTLASKSSCMAA